MRIIAGELKGREISVARGSRIRPATGIVRETVMSLFTPAKLASGVFLDLCAGSGLVGLEALSRGAPKVVFVETDGSTAAKLRQAIKRFGVAARCTVLKQDVRRCFGTLMKNLAGGLVTCAFLDPPYISGLAADLLTYLGRHAEVLAQDALLIVRTPDELATQAGNLQLVERRQCGNAWLWMYIPEGQGGEQP